MADTYRVIDGEFRKLTTTRLWLWMLLAAMALTALYASLLIGFSGDPDTFTAPLDSPAGQRTLFAVAAGGANTLIAVLAAIGLTGEFRHKTATATFLATPHRGRIVIAKLIAYAILGIGYAVACLTVVTAIALPWLVTKDIDLSLMGNGIPGTMAAVIADIAIFALVGVGLGALLRTRWPRSSDC